MDELARRNGEHDTDLSLEADSREQNIQGSDEARLQFHQPDESLMAQDNIADRGIATPEEIACSDEIIAIVETALLGARAEEREAFLLYAIEGFSPDEIAVIGERTPEQVRQAILSAREHLRKALPVPNVFKEKLLQQTRIA
jgi:RNA polymerase sigma factor (sigma-70 family)